MLRAALAIADREGIEALSMRHLAQKLGVEAMSLYNHVANKDEILRGILELVGDEVDLAEDATDWKEATRRRLSSARDVLARHPWAAGLWMSRGGSRGARMRFADAVLRGLREGGLPPDAVYHGFHVLQSHLTGYALYEQSLAFDAKKVRRLAADFLRRFPAGEYPDLAEHVRQHLEPTDARRGTFAYGLDLILDGLERLRSPTDTAEA